MPAKIMLSGTRFSTLADAEGNFEFSGLPPGRQAIWVMRPGNEIASRTIVLSSRDEQLNLSLRPDKFPDNLLRNPDFRLSWVTDDVPDTWAVATAPRARRGWESELIPVAPGEAYRLAIEWKQGADSSEVLVRWRTEQNHPVAEDEPLKPPAGEVIRRAPQEAKFAQILIVAPRLGAAVQWVGFSRTFGHD